MRAILLTLLLFLPAQSGLCGAWPREKGSGFASASLRFSHSPQGENDRYSTFYLEYGLTRRLILGADFGHAVSGGGKAILYLRRPAKIKLGQLVYALEAGIGRVDGRDVFRPGVAFGKGLTFANGQTGWAVAQGYAEFRIEDLAVDAKLDLTFGLNLKRDRKAMIQIQMGQQAGDAPFARIASSYVIPVHANRHIEIGLSYDLMGSRTIGAQIGLWQSF